MEPAAVTRRGLALLFRLAFAQARDLPAARAQLVGRASWYGAAHHGRRTASGARFDMHAMTAAHRTLAFGTLVEVRDLDTGRRVVVTVNDRGPYIAGRVIDLSRAAAAALGMERRGVASVELRLLRSA